MGSDPQSDGFAVSPTLEAVRLAVETASLEPGTAVGRYTIEGLLGAGGMGEVYAARDPELERDIAIKVLRRDRDGADLEARTRILREAQALARLDHPNIVAIHDVGSLDERLFVAMQRVGGVSLAQWLRETPRPWREVRRVFLAAGRGLEAAHAVGIVHRDFKPHNVMVDGERVVVLDFGLARHDGQTDTPMPSSSDIGLTRSGDLVGTPAYMAPEQLAGAPATVRSDQWSFCVALFEGLFGRRPFTGDNLAELTRSIQRGQLTVPRGAAVPRWLTALTLRGLRADPAERHASMSALLRALERTPRRRLRLALGAAALAAAAGWLALRPTAERPCARAGAALAGVWDPAARARMQAAFAAVGRPFAAESFTRAAAALDGYAQGFTAMRVEACEATVVRGEQSPHLMDLRMECLDRRRDELRALVATLSGAPDAETAGRAAEAVDGLTRVAACADRDALAARVPLPEDAEARREVLTLSARLDEAEALLGTANLKGIAVLDGDLARAAASTHAPLRARALLFQTRRFGLAGQLERTGPLAEEALQAATAARDDSQVAAAWLEILEARRDAGKYEDAIGLAALSAQAALARAGSPVSASVRLECGVADALARLGRYDEARARFDRAIELGRLAGPNSRPLAMALSNSAMLLGRLRAGDAWRARTAEAVAAVEAAWGPRHYQLAAALESQANAAADAGDFTQAEELHRRALAILADSVGLDGMRAATVYLNQGVMESKRHQQEKAVALFEKALPLMERQLGGDHPELLPVLLNLSGSFDEIGRYDEARALLERARRIAEAHLPPDHPRFAFIEEGLYNVAKQQERWEEAREHANAALELLRKKIPTTSTRLIPALSRVGEANAELHDWDRSLKAYEEIFVLLRDNKVPQLQRAQMHWALAQVLDLAGRDPRRARELAEEAERVFAEAKDETRLQHVQKWLARKR